MPASRDGSARHAAAWRLLFLSTGEIGVADKMREGRRAGGRVMAGQAVRVLEIPADAGAGHGVFETCHGFPSGQALSDHLKRASGQHYGHALRAYLARLVRERERVAAEVSAFIPAMVDDMCPAGADGQVRRAAQRFALIAAGGELACQFGIVPWPTGAAKDAAEHLFRAWLTARGGSDPAEITAGIAAVRQFIEAHGSSRFAPWDQPDRVVQNRAGFSRPDAADGTTYYYVLPEAWRTAVLPGHDAGLIAREMVQRGLLKVTADGKPQVKQRLPDRSEMRVYVVLPALQSAEAE